MISQGDYESKDNYSSDSNKMEFETALCELEKIVQALEQGDLTLEQSMEKFQKGMELSKICNAKLKQAEEQIEKLTKDTDTGELKFQKVELEEE